ncbi:MAG: hypothetical protein SFW09_13900 [Hyphomicrobiaceae bacterium]|nr:hypothetical protein [Hyphomicrobiaceae bacterium]
MRSFKLLVRIRIVANLLLGGLLLLAPDWPFDWLHEVPPAQDWLVRAIGVWLVYAALAHVASAVAPAIAMSSNLFVVLGPILPVALLIWLGLSVPSRPLLMLAVYETVFVLLLSRTFQAGWLADLNTKP